MTFQDTDLFLINRSDVNYKISYLDLINKTGVQSSDLLMVQRGGALYKVTFQALGQTNPTIQETDFFLVQRGQEMFAKQANGAVITAPHINLSLNTAVSSSTGLSFSYRGAQGVNGVPPQVRDSNGNTFFLPPGDGIIQLSSSQLTSNVTIYGQFTFFNFNGSDCLLGVSSSSGTAADWAAIMPTPDSDFGTNCYRNCSRLTVIDVNAPYQTMYRFLYQATNYNNSQIDNVDVSQITDFTQCFASASAFNQDISGWDMSSATNLGDMFSEATSFNKNLNIWGPSLGGVTLFFSMFQGATSYNQPMNSWDVTGTQTQGMNAMFRNASAFTQDLTGWCVTNFPAEPDFFSEGSALTSVQLPVWGTCP